MNKTEKLAKLNTYKVFKLYNNLTSLFIIEDPVNYMEIVKFISSEAKFWTKLDNENNINDGYGISYQNILDNLQSMLDDEDFNFNSEKEFIEFVKRYYLNSDNYQCIENNSNNITIRLEMINRGNEIFQITKPEYIRLMKLQRPGAIPLLINLLNNKVNLYNIIEKTRYSSGEDANEALISYIGLKTKNIRRIDGRKEVISELDMLKDDILDFAEDFNETKNTLLADTLDYQQKLNNWEAEKEVWYETQQEKLNDLEKSYKEKQNELEVMYAEKLRLEKPAKFWETEIMSKRKAYLINLCVTCILSVFVILAGAYLISTLYNFAISETFNKQFIPFSFVMVALITFLIYLLRMSIKIMLSSKHLQTEYQQKKLFTEFYLCLLNDNMVKPQITETEKNLIYQNLFSNPDSGLIKANSESNELMTLLTAMLSKK